MISAAHYAVLGCLAAAVALSFRQILPFALALVILLSLWITLIVLFRGNARRLKAPRLLLGVPFYALWRPFVNLVYRIRGKQMRESNYTWQRLRK
jgi:hypothetical protein